VINTSLFNTDWYIDQMKRPAYKSKAIPSQLTHDKYVTGTRDAIWYVPVSDSTDIKTWMNWVASDDPRTKEELRNGQLVNTFPSKKIRIPVDKESVLRNKIVDLDDADEIVPYIDIELKGDILYKNRLIMLDIVANNNWERPIYFTGGSFGDDDYLWMKDYLQLDGVCFKLIPINTPVDPRNPYDMGRIDGDKMYDIVKNWYWGGSGDPDIYHDRETRTNGITYRGNMARLVEQLLNEDKPEKAKEILDLAMEKMPIDTFEFYTLVEPYITGYYQLGERDRAREIWNELAKKYQEQLIYFDGLSPERRMKNYEEIYSNMEKYRSLLDLLVMNREEDIIVAKAEEFNSYMRLFPELYGDDEAEDPERLETVAKPAIEIPADSQDIE
jgi:hypothetical protein